jgi:hypothetical protein
VRDMTAGERFVYERFVPKIHPATREVESDDPMEIVATPVAGDVDMMLECIVQEFAWMGWDEEQMWRLFCSADYPALAGLREALGDDELRCRLRTVLTRQGAFRVSETISQEPDLDEPIEPELIQITVRPRR